MTAPHTEDELTVTVDAGVATLWLNRPAKRNAVTYEMWLGIAARCDELAADPDVRLLVVRGVGEHFCAGADIAGLTTVERPAYKSANEAADRALAAFPKPTLAVISGSCVGGGVEIAVACDLRLADTTARFGITPARLGIVYPAMAVERVVRVIGPAATKQLLYTAELVDAAQALAVGLVNEVHPPEALEPRAEQLAELLVRRRSLLSQMASKEMVDAVAAGGAVDEEISDRWERRLASSPDLAEGIAAFAERREPRFTWVPET